MKILVDMNLSPRWAAELRSKGLESIHWQSIGAANASDEEVLAWCAAHGLRFAAALSAENGEW